MNEKFVARFSKLKEESKLSYESLAEKSGLSVRALKYYATGEREPGIEAVSKLCDLFDVPADYLLARGVFAHWERLMEEKERTLLVATLEEMAPELKALDLTNADERKFMRILPTFLDKVEIIDKPNGEHEMDIKYLLYPESIAEKM